MTLPPLPEPDTHCFDDDTRRDVWSYSYRQMRAYAELAVAAERERLRDVLVRCQRHLACNAITSDLVRLYEDVREALKEPT